MKGGNLDTRNLCTNHKKDVAGISDMEQLAEMVGDLHYKSLLKFLQAFSLKILKDGLNDTNAGREKLGKSLLMMHHGLNKAANEALEVWRISRPYTK